MLRGSIRKNSQIRTKSSSSDIRKTFIEYFVQNHGHKHVKSSSVVPLCDPTVPFVNAGMNQVKLLLTIPRLLHFVWSHDSEYGN